MSVVEDSATKHLETSSSFNKELSAPVPAPIQRDPVEERRAKCTFSQLITAVAVSLLSLVMGYATAYTSPAEASLRRDMYLGNGEISWIGGLLPLSAVFGGLLGGISIGYCGRKGTLFLINIIFLISWLLIYYAENFYYIYVSRCLAGCSLGLATLTLPVYLVETLQPEVRGVLGLLPMTFGNIGILLCFIYGIFVEWKFLAAIGILLSLPFLVFFLWIIPESPTWYLHNNKPDKCMKTLAWLRNDKQDVTEEFNNLVRAHNEKKSRNTRLTTLFKHPNLKPLSIILCLMFFQQFSGINAVIFYTTSIFRASRWDLSPMVCTTIIGLVNLLATFLANGLIDKLGRKLLLQASSIMMTMGLGCLGFYYYVKEILDVDVEEYGFLTLINLIIFVAGFSIGFGPIPWLMMGELLPLEIKSLAAALATSVNWICTFVITVTFPSITQMFGYFAVFWFYCCMVITAGLLTWLFVPETRGRSLDDIERRLSGHQNIQHAKSIAMLKPFPATTM
ncbi:facilitated trehalose transporter Tret1-2 homolog [Coccinella septempunctata]|uniref:facilitated trehalose transporter Tret1-2 homolog n=1 Tax=Coccinella septempunctata TaxID=41139 RepID=UPI001D08B7E5|nr:facilitated trehalose transporter Tret1-2 homolog [Coccinella septempunctata]